MIGSAEWRPFLRQIVEEGGDIVDVARAIRIHGANGHYMQAAAALRKEFGLKIWEALAVIGWAECDADDDESLAHLRSEVKTPLT